MLNVVPLLYFIRIELIKPSSKTEEVTLPESETPTLRTEFTKIDDPRFKKKGDY
jgi:23S rRNA pseudouridine2604 synthase